MPKSNDPKDYELWQVEYAAQVMKGMSDLGEIDFDHRKAQLFKSGWDCCFHCATVAIGSAMATVGKE